MSLATKEASYLIEYLKESFAKLTEEYKQLNGNDRKLRIISKAEYASLSPIILKNTNIVYAKIYQKNRDDSVNMNVLEDKLVRSQISKYVMSKPDSLLFTHSTVYMDKEDLIQYEHHGVFGLIEQMNDVTAGDNMDTLKMKLPAWDVILRHEIGHVLVNIEYYKNLTINEFDRIDRNIGKFDRDQTNRWDLEEDDQSDPFHHSLKFKEAAANEVMGISAAEIVAATQIVGFSPLGFIGRMEKKEGEKTRNENKKNNNNSNKK